MSRVPEPSEAAARLGGLLRQLNRAVLDPELTDATRRRLVEELSGSAEGASVPTSRYLSAEAADFRAGPGGKIDPRGTHPLYGAASGTGVAMSVGVTAERLSLGIRFDVRHEGAPGWVHGGFVAAMFDVALGRAASEFGARGPTANMSISYTSPTPVDVDVVVDAWLDRREGRKSFVGAELRLLDGGGVCATAEALFIQPVSS
jgi:acyl-coenzyme A thioesterase PaaI-like protein